VVRVKSDGMYRSALLFKRGPLYESLRKRYPRFVEFFEKCTSEGVCPFCKRKFSRFALYRHLSRNPSCARSLTVLFDYLRRHVDEDVLLVEVVHAWR
jgi:hypothetical protein